MSDPKPQSYEHEEDLPPDTIVELESLEEEEPIALEEQDVSEDAWPRPPENWRYDAHDEDYRDDPDVVIAEDDISDGPEPMAETETSV